MKVAEAVWKKKKIQLDTSVVTMHLQKIFKKKQCLSKGTKLTILTIKTMGKTQKSSIFMYCLFSFLEVTAETNSAYTSCNPIFSETSILRSIHACILRQREVTRSRCLILFFNVLIAIIMILETLDVYSITWIRK